MSRADASKHTASDSDQHNRVLFEHNPNPMLVIHRDSHDILAANNAAVELYGYTRDELLALKAEDIRPPEDIKIFQKVMKTIPDELHRIYKPHRHVHKDGSVIDVEVISHGIEWNGQPARMALVRDVTEQLAAQTALKQLNESLEQRVAKRTAELEKTVADLRRSEARYRGLIESQDDMIVRVDLENRFTFVNDAYCKFFGKTRDELIGNTFVPLVHEEDRATTLEAMEGVMRPPYRISVEQRAFAANGWRWLIWEDVGILDDDGKVVEIQAIGRDITARKLGEQAVRSAEKRFRTIFERANIGIALSGPDDMLVQTNPSLQRMLGYAPEELHGRLGFAQITHADDLNDSRLQYERLMSGEIENYTIRKRYLRKDGDILWAQVSVSAVRDAPAGRPYVISMIEDITEPRNAEEALRQSEQRFRAMFENSGLGVVLIDRSGKSLAVNPALCHFLGFQPGDLDDDGGGGDGIHFARVTHPDDLEVTHTVYRALSEGETDQAKLEKRYICKDGRIVWGRTTFSAVRDKQGQLQYTVAIVEDITELKRAEETGRRHEAERAHFARLISMGEMAAGLAHQLNQPLTAVVNYTQGCVRRLQSNNADQAAVIHAMDEAATQARRAGQIVQHLRRFIQKREPTRAPVDVNELVGECVSLLADMRAQQRGIKIELSLAHDLPKVLADAVQLEQVVLNLLSNGIEAIAQANAKRRIIRVSTRSPAENLVEVMVSDTSGQAPQGDLEQLFEPFFTTKDDGLGMGLKVSRSIITAHGGRLWAYVNEDGGLNFHFVLPTGDE